VPDLLISDLAECSGVPASTLRYYEQQGLLPAARTPAGYRRYDQASVERLRFISAAKHLHLSLDSIRDLLGAWDAEPCRTVKAQLRPMIQSRLGQVDEGIAELRELEASLRTALCRLDELPDSGEHCDRRCAFLDDPLPAKPSAADVPIACSLAGPEHAQRLARWREMLYGAPRDQVLGGVLVLLPTTAAVPLAELILAEQQCCPFLQFQIGFTSTGLRLAITAEHNVARVFIDDLLPSAQDVRS
jgi:MerR family copper efflux transcriptional regulator